MWGPGRRRRWPPGLRSPGHSRRGRARRRRRSAAADSRRRFMGSSRDWVVRTVGRPADAAAVPVRSSSAEPGVLGIQPRDLSRSQSRASPSSSGQAAVEVAVVLAPLQPGLVEQHDLGVEVADAVVGHPGDLLDGRDVVGQPLVGPQAVAVGRERQVEDPRRRGRRAGPRSGSRGAATRASGRQRPQRSVGDVPQLPLVSPTCSRRAGTSHARIETSTSSCSRGACRAGEGLDRPAADDPPRPRRSPAKKSRPAWAGRSGANAPYERIQ